MGELCGKVHDISNPQDETCGICRGMTRVFKHTLGETAYVLPEERGSGYLKRSAAGKSIEIVMHDFLFHKEICLKSMSVLESFQFCFCLGDSLQWSLEGVPGSFIMEGNQSQIFPAGAFNCAGRYEAGFRYRGISISLYPDRFAPVLECFRAADAVTDTGDIHCARRKYKMTASAMELAGQIINCPLGGLPGRLYIEGKVLELIAVYLDEMVREKGKGPAAVNLSREDMESLRRVKERLDESFAAPMTISGLAKLVYMNEYKLKAGFKKIYGKPIYGYVIDRRMETAKRLLDESKVQVKEAAGRVGYTNISHFIEAFRKKFGVNPGVYLKTAEKHHQGLYKK